MRNQTQAGDVITVIAPYALASGDGCRVGAFFGVATSAAVIGSAAEIATEGVYDLSCLGTDTPAFGALLYWDNTNRRLTTTASGNTLVGAAMAAKASGPTVVSIRLNGVAL